MAQVKVLFQYFFFLPVLDVDSPFLQTFVFLDTAFVNLSVITNIFES